MIRLPEWIITYCTRDLQLRSLKCEAPDIAGALSYGYSNLNGYERIISVLAIGHESIVGPAPEMDDSGSRDVA